MVGEDLKLSVRDLSISYGDQPALSGVSLDVREHEIFGIIGPAGSGKTSFLRTLNRMEILQENMTVEGSIVFGGRDISEIKNVFALRQGFQALRRRALLMKSWSGALQELHFGMK